ncbi:hypothetical protein ACJJIF_12035 [Microbulbifer sp. SSSA002]|uniref:hypothetical protein n=1 Tax=Microbulbifer sp. SSSA002 TaxID=3243376 RepID=UPI004039D9C8
MKKWIYVISAYLFVGYSHSIYADPFGIGKDYADICSASIYNQKSEGFGYCLGFYIGVVKNYNYAYQAGIMHPYKMSDLDYSNPEVMEKFGEIGDASSNGVIRAYCTKSKATYLDELKSVVPNIISDSELHKIPANAAIMKSLEKLYPCA